MNENKKKAKISKIIEFFRKIFKKSLKSTCIILWVWYY